MVTGWASTRSNNQACAKRSAVSAAYTRLNGHVRLVTALRCKQNLREQSHPVWTPPKTIYIYCFCSSYCSYSVYICLFNFLHSTKSFLDITCGTKGRPAFSASYIQGYKNQISSDMPFIFFITKQRNVDQHYWLSFSLWSESLFYMENPETYSCALVPHLIWTSAV